MKSPLSNKDLIKLCLENRWVTNKIPKYKYKDLPINEQQPFIKNNHHYNQIRYYNESRTLDELVFKIRCSCFSHHLSSKEIINKISARAEKLKKQD